MKTSGRLSVLAVLVVASSAASWAGPPLSNAASSPVPPVKPGPTQPAPYANDTIGFDAPQQIASSRLRDFLDASPDANGGLSSSGPSHVTVHMLTGDSGQSPSLAAQISQTQAAGVTVDIDHVTRSTSDLEKLQSSVCSSATFSQARVTGCGVDPDTNSVRVGLETLTDAVAVDSAQSYGDAVTVVQQGVPTLAGRLSDTVPYIAGDAWGYVTNSILGTTTHHCTEGFTMTDRFGNDYAMTAGHCFGAGVTGVKTYTANQALGGPGTINSTQLGTEYFTQYTGTCSPGGSQYCYDGAIIKDQSYAGLSWIGGVGTNTLQGITGVTNANEGTYLYFAGAVTGQTVLGVTTGPPFCYSDSAGNWQCALQRVNRVGGTGTLCQGGDSGGPVYGPDGQGGLIAVGQIDACASDGSYGYYTMVPTLLSGWTATIKIG